MSYPLTTQEFQAALQLNADYRHAHFVSKVAQSVKAPVIGEELPLYKVPVVGRFVGETQGVSSETSRFYNNLQKIGEHKDPIKRMKEDGEFDKLNAYKAEHPEIRLEDEANRISRLVSDSDKRRRKAIEEGNREEVKRQEDRKKTLMNAFNSKVKAKLEQPQP